MNMPRLKESDRTYKGSGSASPVNNEVGHISNEVSRQTEVEEHEENVEKHFSWILSMQISISCSR